MHYRDISLAEHNDELDLTLMYPVKGNLPLDAQTYMSHHPGGGGGVPQRQSAHYVIGHPRANGPTGAGAADYHPTYVEYQAMNQ